jgi:hypothetical protein
MCDIDPSMYERHHKAFVLEHRAERRQKFGNPLHHGGLTDLEIAAELGITARDVAEIRCIAEVERLPQPAADHRRERLWCRAQTTTPAPTGH